ncbi:hypothetical protein FRB98_003677 [Tulasnella sp. 332]|nr:hypothetical protein FRB98_003677 [Tulasnella sp. 332]
MQTIASSFRGFFTSVKRSLQSFFSKLFTRKRTPILPTTHQGGASALIPLCAVGSFEVVSRGRGVEVGGEGDLPSLLVNPCQGSLIPTISAPATTTTTTTATPPLVIPACTSPRRYQLSDQALSASPGVATVVVSNPEPDRCRAVIGSSDATLNDALINIVVQNNNHPTSVALNLGRQPGDDLEKTASSAIPNEDHDPWTGSSNSPELDAVSTAPTHVWTSQTSVSSDIMNAGGHKGPNSLALRVASANIQPTIIIKPFAPVMTLPESADAVHKLNNSMIAYKLRLEIPPYLPRREQHSTEPVPQNEQACYAETSALSGQPTPSTGLVIFQANAASSPTAPPHRRHRRQPRILHASYIGARTNVALPSPIPLGEESDDYAEAIPVEDILRADLTSMDQKIMVLAEFSQRLGSIVGLDPLGPECVDEMLSCDHAKFVALAGPRLTFIESEICRTLAFLVARNEQLAAQVINSQRMYEELSERASELRDNFVNLHADHRQLKAQHEELAEYSEGLRVEYNDLATEYEQFRNASEEATVDCDRAEDMAPRALERDVDRYGEAGSEDGEAFVTTTDDTRGNEILRDSPAPPASQLEQTSPSVADHYSDYLDSSILPDHSTPEDNIYRPSSPSVLQSSVDLGSLTGTDVPRSTESTCLESEPLDSEQTSSSDRRSRSLHAAPSLPAQPTSHEQPYHPSSVPFGPYMGQETGADGRWGGYTGHIETAGPRLVFDDARRASHDGWSAAVFPS